MPRTVYLVGTIPLANATEVFRTVSRIVGPALRWLPDGETGERRSWLPWLEPIFSTHPAFERTEEMYRRTPGDTGRASTQLRYRLKPGMSAKDVTFEKLPHAKIALDSWREFERLKKQGVIPERCRYQVDFAGIVSVVRRYVVPEQQLEVGFAYERGVVAEIAKIAAVVPRDQLAIQWDVASAVFQHLETNTPCAYGETREEMLESFSDWHARLGDDVPEGVDLLYHLCYGDANHRHSVEPSTAALLVEFSNRLAAKTKRSIELIHMPVPRNRHDDAYFAPLKDLTLEPETVLALGLVHYTDGVEGTKRRMEAAQKYAPNFAIATECGFGRRPPETVPQLLEIHAEAAGLR
jgi:hypothetical protein